MPRPQRNPPRKTGQAKKNWEYGALAGIATVVLGIAGGGAWLAAQNPPPDPETLCPRAGPTGITVLLIDSTDSLGAIQRAAVLGRITRFVEDLRLGEELAIYQISPAGDPLKPVLKLCRPTKPEEQNELVGSKKMAQQRFEAEFKTRIRETLETSIARPGADRSPIMEAIQGAAVASIQPLQTGPGTKKLIVVSDMLENGAGGSHYGAVPVFSEFRRTPAFSKTRSDMNGVEVRILYLRRDAGAGVQGTSHKEFWAEWFDAQEASVESVVEIEG